MRRQHRWAVAILAAGAAAAASAQTAPTQAKPPPPAASAIAATARAPAGDPLAPTLTVIEDDGVRIEETRLRGQPQKIIVQSKVGNVRAYQIIVGAGGSDPSQDRGAAGRRAWSLFDF